MHRLLGKLIEILSREVDRYSGLVELMREERGHIASNNVDQLDEVLKHQNTIILELKALEEARKVLIRKLAELLGLPFEGVTLRKLIDVVEEPYATMLAGYGDRIDELVAEIKRLNDDNSYLIDKSIEYITGALQIFISAGAIPGQGNLICDVA
ncbi:flagellar protein FlgN [Candidatus Poribacteria bacterium]|nr:flagellar protein FlgN [Candidatus Poribacteria bacterium]